MCQAKNHVVPIAVTPRTILESGKLQNEMHAGLWMDKFVQSWNQQDPTKDWQNSVQRPAIEEVVRLSQNSPKNLDFAKLLARHRLLTHREPTKTFLATAISPFALHLARASSLENASVCLHPIYGFAYIPGSGLKGMAHAYACEIFLPTQADPEQAWSDICNVFGHAPSPWLRDLAKSLDNRFGSGVGKAKIIAPRDASTGSVVFHDAWPAQWPKLICDIVNCHHTDYYGASDKIVPPPGDWENPNPVYFAAIAPNTTFEFAISPRGCTRLTATPSACASSITELATQWLAGALTRLGAGSKTNAGYGTFRIDNQTNESLPLLKEVQNTWQNAIAKKARAEFTCTLELVTPAFLSGANHDDPSGCDLRPATLRGQLRWWWRTMHAGHLDPASLRQLETAIWGDSKTGGAVRIELEPLSPKQGQRFDKFQFASVTDRCSEYGIPNATDSKKVAAGIAYLAFGMDEAAKDHAGNKTRKQRFCMEQAAGWRIRLIARGMASYDSDSILTQAKSALFLLARFGGVGSKSRNGFGSLQLFDAESDSLQVCLDNASSFRTKPQSTKPMGNCETSAFSAVAGNVAVLFPWSDVWTVLEQVGFAVQAFAISYKHRITKQALGLPRLTKTSERFSPSGTFSEIWETAVRKRDERNVRYASPWHIQLSPHASGFVVRCIAFVQPGLPSADASSKLLHEWTQFVKADLERRAKLSPLTITVRPRNVNYADVGKRSTAAQSGKPTSASAKRANGSAATVKILGVRIKGGYDVQEVDRPKSGVLNLGTVPTPLPEIGSLQSVFIHDDNPTCPQYRWDNPHAGKTPKKPHTKNKGWK